MSRTTVLVLDHLQPIIDHMVAQLSGFTQPSGLVHSIPVGFGERPIDPDAQHYPPPYLVVSYLPGGTLDGPLSDSQADITLRVLLLATGSTAREATVLRDITHAQMQKENFIVTNRKIRNLTVDSPTDGIFRDDDAPTPIFYTRQIYLMDTTPS